MRRADPLDAATVSMVSSEGASRHPRRPSRPPPRPPCWRCGSPRSRSGSSPGSASPSSTPTSSPRATRGCGWWRPTASPVGFVMVSWDVVPVPDRIWGPYYLWRLLVDHRHQGRGYGAAAVRLVAEAVRDAGGETAPHELRHRARGRRSRSTRGSASSSPARSTRTARPTPRSTSGLRTARMSGDFVGIHTGSFSTPPRATRRSSWSRRPTATTASTRATSTARSPRPPSATP